MPQGELIDNSGSISEQLDPAIDQASAVEDSDSKPDQPKSSRRRSAKSLVRKPGESIRSETKTESRPAVAATPLRSAFLAVDPGMLAASVSHWPGDSLAGVRRGDQRNVVNQALVTLNVRSLEDLLQLDLHLLRDQKGIGSLTYQSFTRRIQDWHTMQLNHQVLTNLVGRESADWLAYGAERKFTGTWYGVDLASWFVGRGFGETSNAPQVTNLLSYGARRLLTERVKVSQNRLSIPFVPLHLDATTVAGSIKRPKVSNALPVASYPWLIELYQGKPENELYQGKPESAATRTFLESLTGISQDHRASVRTTSACVGGSNSNYSSLDPRYRVTAPGIVWPTSLAYEGDSYRDGIVLDTETSA